MRREEGMNGRHFYGIPTKASLHRVGFPFQLKLPAVTDAQTRERGLELAMRAKASPDLTDHAFLAMLTPRYDFLREASMMEV